MAVRVFLLILCFTTISISNAISLDLMKTSMSFEATTNMASPLGYFETTTVPYTKHPAPKKPIECGSKENIFKGFFTPLDYSIVIGMLVISLGIGVFYGFCRKDSSGGTSADFMLGSNMNLFPVTLSLTTSFITAIELLGNPSEMFYNGTQFALIVISIVFVIPVAIKIFYPIYFKLDITSCYEYLGIRFDTKLRVLGAVLYIIQMSFYTSVAVLAPAIALAKATGLNQNLAVVLIYLICIFYSSQGGMKAVVIADTFQACVLAVSLILVLALGHFYTGDITKVLKTSNERDRIELFNIDPNPTTRHTVWSVVIGGFFYWTSMFCTNQASVQKCMSLKTIKRAKIAIFFSVLGLVTVFLMNFFTGLMVFTHYSDCDPFISGKIIAKDQLLPFYIMDVFENINFLTGIFVAGIFAASLGTVASALSSLSAVTCEDLLAAALNIKVSPEKGALYAKWMSLGYGILSFALVFLVEKLGGILQATLTLNGLIGGVTLGLFLLGIFFKRANSTGALYGGIISLILVVYLGVMSQIKNKDPVSSISLSIDKCNCYVNTTKLLIEEALPQLIDTESVPAIYRISYMWYSFLSASLTIFIGIVVSFITEILGKHKDKFTLTTIITTKRRRTNTTIANVTEKMEKCKFDPVKKNHKENIFICVKNENEKKIKSQLQGADNLALKIDE